MNTLPGIDPTVFTHHTAQANGVQLHYVRGGQGPVVLLWHGFLETWYCWRKIMPVLAKQYTVIAPDMRGYGDSDKPDHGYDVRTLADVDFLV
ncbi:MAG: alpha/beta fold hydrolase [Nostoc sp.]|uniref:alpha/beta fold hydrolase n=1 Tax=Nostoc sp. TaxID=1180 RepID=UPI002FF36CD5